MPKGKKIVWTDEMREQAVKFYDSGFSPVMIAEKMGLSRTPVRLLLSTERPLRSHIEASLCAVKNGRHFSGLLIPKQYVCGICGDDFTSRSATAVVCSRCAPRGTIFQRIAYEYGISKQQYEKMLENQNNMCAVCREKPPRCIDHCHKTGKVRGLLCHGCNSGIGHLEKENGWLNKAQKYLGSENKI